MSVREYIGARYVPLFADPIDWDSTKTYEPLTVVYNQGNSYTSRQYVPAGIDISNDTYWARTGNYNAQIEQYRSEVATFDDRITTNETNITDLQNATVGTEKLDDNAVTTAKIKNANVTTDKLADNAVTTAKIKNANVTTDKLADNAVTTAKIKNANVTTDKLADNAVTTAKIKNANVTTDKLADNAVTTDKLADNAVTTAKIKDGNITRNKIRNPYVGLIGDSFSVLNNPWINYFADITGRPVINKAVSRAGFTTGTTFYEQLNNLKNDTNFENCDTIIVFGGVNDWNNAKSSVNAMESAFSNFLDNYKSINNAPKLIFAFGTIGKSNQNIYNGYANWYNGCINSMRKLGIPGIVDYVPSWSISTNQHEFFRDDNLHPTTIGNKEIASYFASILNGTYCGVHKTYYNTINLNEDVYSSGTIKYEYYFDNNKVDIKCYISGTMKNTTYPKDWTAVHSDDGDHNYIIGDDVSPGLNDVAYSSDIMTFETGLRYGVAINPDTTIAEIGPCFAWNPKSDKLYTRADLANITPNNYKMAFSKNPIHVSIKRLIY